MSAAAGRSSCEASVDHPQPHTGARAVRAIGVAAALVLALVRLAAALVKAHRRFLADHRALRERIHPVAARARLKIGRAHVCTPVTNAHLVCRLLLEKKKKTRNKNTHKQIKSNNERDNNE